MVMLIDVSGERSARTTESVRIFDMFTLAVSPSDL